MSKGNQYHWSSEAVQMLKERYQIDGPKKLAEILGTTNNSVIMKARRLGIEPKVGRIQTRTTWTEDMEAIVREKYPTMGNDLALELGIPKYTLQHKVIKMGIRCTTGHEKAAKAKANNNKTCNIHYFDEWSYDNAYIFGFLMADGGIGKRLFNVVIGLAEKDRCVLEFIKEQMKCSTKIYLIDRHDQLSNDGCKRQNAVYLYIRSKVIVQRLMDMGMKPRKTYIDEPFPNVPDKYLADFVRGYLDGDGSIVLRDKQRTCSVRFVGSPKFIEGLKNSLVRVAGLKDRPVLLQTYQTTVGRTNWSAHADVKKFHDYIYYKGHGFCLERKKSVLVNYLKTKMDSPIPEQE